MGPAVAWSMKIKKKLEKKFLEKIMIKRKIIGPKQTSVHKELLVKKKPVAQKIILVQKLSLGHKFERT